MIGFVVLVQKLAKNIGLACRIQGMWMRKFLTFNQSKAIDTNINKWVESKNKLQYYKICLYI